VLSSSSKFTNGKDIILVIVCFAPKVQLICSTKPPLTLPVNIRLGRKRFASDKHSSLIFEIIGAKCKSLTSLIPRKVFLRSVEAKSGGTLTKTFLLTSSNDLNN
jgi:hypothetical protein